MALLVRRLRDTCDAAAVQCVGTSATMTTEGDASDQRRAVAEVATTLFGVPGPAGSRDRGDAGADHRSGVYRPGRLRHGASASPRRPEEFAAFTADPLPTWIEEVFGFEPGSPAAARSGAAAR